MAELFIFEFVPKTKEVKKLPDPMNKRVMQKELAAMQKHDAITFCFDAIHRLSLPELGYEKVLIMRGDSNGQPPKPKRHAKLAFDLSRLV